LKLPSLGYKFIVFRAHSGLLAEDGQVYEGSWLFSSEPCQQDLNHADQRLTRKIAKARVDENYPWVFAVGSNFVSQSMQGQFDKTVILTMGCYSFIRDDMAEAFIKKGASAYLGWTSLVNLDYTDKTTETLIRYWCQKDETLKKAMDRTVSELGPEPNHDTKMLYYPSTNGDKTLNKLFQ
jgi:hypothetical protein